jgi:radical SAM protein with 4Fe4S-binding SPASM domain
MTAPTSESRRTVRRPHHDVDDRPFIVIWESTQACPLACRHCRAFAQPLRDPNELTTVEATTLMEQVASFGHPAPLFIITGGDPFSRPDLYDLVRAGAAAGLGVAVSPSATPTLTRENLAALHDSFRGVEGVFDRTIQGWKDARDVGLRVQINTTVTRSNLSDLPSIVRIVHELGAMTWSAFMLVPVGRGLDLGQLTAEEVEDVMNFVYDAGTLIPAKTTEGHHFRRVMLQRRTLEELGVDHVSVLGLGPLYQQLRAELELITAGEAIRVRRPPLDINAGRGFVFISHTGEVFPSGFMPISAGNVRDKSLIEIYRTDELLTGLRDPDLLGGKCGQCEYRSLCGGSRSRAYGLTGDAYAAEPWCSYEPGSFPYAVNIGGKKALS